MMRGLRQLGPLGELVVDDDEGGGRRSKMGYGLTYGQQIGLLEPRYNVQKMQETEMAQRGAAQSGEAAAALEGR